MRKNIIIIFLIGGVAALLVGWLVYEGPIEVAVDNVTPPSVEGRPAAPAAPADDPVLVAAYQAQIGDLTRLADGLLSASATGTPSALKDQLLKIRVPAEYRDWHLAFFFALNELSSATESGDQGRIEAGRIKLKAVIGKAGWLQEI